MILHRVSAGRILAGGLFCLFLLSGPGQAFSFSGSYEEIIMLGEKEVASFKVMAEGNRVRTEFLGMPEAEVVISNEEGTYRYQPSAQKALRLPRLVDRSTLLDDLDHYMEFLENNQAEKIGEEEIDGLTADVYRFQDPLSKGPARAWVWREKSFPLKIEVKAPEGLLTVHLKKIELGIDLDDALFVLPPDTEIIELEQPFIPPAPDAQPVEASEDAQARV